MARDTKIRKPNFTDEEISRLLESIELEKECMQCKLQGSLTGRQKEAWDRVLFKVNCMARQAQTPQPTHLKLLTIHDSEIEMSYKVHCPT